MAKRTTRRIALGIPVESPILPKKCSIFPSHFTMTLMGESLKYLTALQTEPGRVPALGTSRGKHIPGQNHLVVVETTSRFAMALTRGASRRLCAWNRQRPHSYYSRASPCHADLGQPSDFPLPRGGMRQAKHLANDRFRR
jgi:hypothetical protein